MDIIKPHLRFKGFAPMTYQSVDEVLYFLLVHSYIKNNEFHKKLEILKEKKIPTLVVYGEKDKLIIKSNFEELISRLGADRRDYIICSDNNTIEKHIERENWIKVLAIRSGGHFAYQRNSDIVNKYLKQLLLS